MAAASDTTTVQRLESLLTCNICKEALKEPRTLPCFHSYCKGCLTTYIKIRQQQREKGRKERRARCRFNCPTCRTKCKLKQDEGVERLPSNYFINNMLDILTIQQQAQKLPCESCKAQLPAACRCIECERYLCGNCLTTHNNWPDFKDHAVLTLEELAKPENQAKAKGKPRCLNHGHGNKPLEFYCNACHELACITCVLLDHARAGHDYQPIDVVADQHKEALKTTSAVLQEKSNEGRDALQKIEHATQNLQANTKKAKDAIFQQEQEILDEFTKKLKRNTAVFLDQVDKTHNEVNEKLSKQRDDMKVYVEKVNGSLDLAKNIIEKGCKEDVVLFANEIKVNANNIEKECPKIIQPVHNGGISYQAKSIQTIVENINLNDLGNVACAPFPKIEKSLIVDPVLVQSLREHSIILNGDIEHAQQLAEWVGDKKFGWQLCFRASHDGWGAEDFHGKCNDAGPTVILVKCETNVFGGYTDQNWQDTYGDYKCSNASFLFSLRNKDNLPPFKCPIYDHQYDSSIYCHSGYGVTFGIDDLYISDNANINQHSCSNLGNTYKPPSGYEYDIPQTKALLGGSEYFTPNEIEVFRC